MSSWENILTASKILKIRWYGGLVVYNGNKKVKANIGFVSFKNYWNMMIGLK